MKAMESIKNIQNELDNLNKLLAEEKIKDTANKDELVKNKFVFYGLFDNDDDTSAKFATEVKLDALTSMNTKDVTSLLNAFGNYERFKIISLLLEKKHTATEIMDKLEFKTTGKVYHHLNALLGAGIIFKDNEYYKIKAKRVQGIIAMLIACHCYLAKSRNDIIDMNALEKN